MNREQGLWNAASKSPARGARAHRPTAWLRISTRMDEHPDIAFLSDAAFRCWVTVLCKAKLQPEPGVFRSEEHLCQLVGWRLARSLPALWDTGLLDRQASGPLAVHNWRRWQSDGSPDLTHAERQRRYRESQANRIETTSRQHRDDIEISSESAPDDIETALVERGNVDVTAVPQPSRVTPSDGDPYIEGSDTVTPPRGAAVTGTQEEGFDRRRDLAAIIRNAPNDAMRNRYRRIFDKTYGHLYAPEAA